MGCLGNVLWFLFAGLWLGIGWCLAGVLWCITIVGIPIGRQCFKLAGLMFSPFGKQVVHGGGAASVIANVFWLLISGLPLALEAVLVGAVLCVTIVGIPFGLQCFKFAGLALAPFGAQVYPA
ncbi:YccF domain-containing protein [Ruminococcaceae bacterium OttesenSCG-928-O06]|nr:YccF domain-containing protein [Ruminococcaceae bacterium OttesenSCG-928-O06]